MTFKTSQNNFKKELQAAIEHLHEAKRHIDRLKTVRDFQVKKRITSAKNKLLKTLNTY